MRETFKHGNMVHSCCSPCIDDDDDIVAGNRRGQRGRETEHHGIVELRPVLRTRLEETELSLAEREEELRRLRQELSKYTSECDLVRGQHTKLVERQEDLRQRTLQRYAVMFDRSKNALLRLGFIGWAQVVEQQTLTDKTLKRGALAFAKSLESGSMSIVFLSWKELWASKKRKGDKRREAVLKRYENLLLSSDNSIMHACFVAWWRLMKDAEVEKHLEQVHMQVKGGASQKVTLKVTVVEAKGLRAADFMGKSDPYVICEMQGKTKQKFTTEVKYKTQNPKWNETHDLTFFSSGDTAKDPILFTVYDKDRVTRDDLLGKVTLPPTQYYPGGYEGELPLTDCGRDVHPRLVVVVKCFVSEVAAPRGMPTNAGGYGGAGGLSADAATMAAVQAAQQAAAAAQSAADAARAAKQPACTCVLL